jgi:hypothetical protein
MKLFEAADILDFSKENAGVNAEKMLYLAIDLQAKNEPEFERALELAIIFEKAYQINKL